jgi:hypothetical protein
MLALLAVDARNRPACLSETRRQLVLAVKKSILFHCRDVNSCDIQSRDDDMRYENQKSFQYFQQWVLNSRLNSSRDVRHV